MFNPSVGLALEGIECFDDPMSGRAISSNAESSGDTSDRP
jgi:hypothetical protein